MHMDGRTWEVRRSGSARQYWILVLACVIAGMMLPPAPAHAAKPEVTVLTQQDFTYGTYIIDQPGVYRLGEDISFNPNSPATLDVAVTSGLIPPVVASALDLTVPVDAYRAGMPLPTQFAHTDPGAFAPGGPLDARYDPAGFGVGFFAAIAITADDVVLDLAGHTIEQSAEHALLQRFFAVIELADQPFIPGQGPASFGTELDAAHRVVIKNGVIGRSSHHGIHGNANADVTVSGIRFDGYEVAAVALNGVDGLTVRNVSAVNRKDVPVLGTFSSAQFIKPYVEHLVASGSPTTLTVDGSALTAIDIRDRLRTAIDAVHEDVVEDAFSPGGFAQIDPSEHPDEYAVFANKYGLLDGNSYSFLVNNIGVAVNGFPTIPDGVTKIASQDVSFTNVHVKDQRAAINEVIALNAGGTAAIDPVGAVFQIRNAHPDTGQPVTVSSFDDHAARYTGNAVANAQALVAKAAASGEFSGTHLDITRLNISASVLDWVEASPGSETLADIGAAYYCNGDSMFHVNKGVIGFKMDAAKNVRMVNTSVDGLVNLGRQGDMTCGDYMHDFSHPLANIYGYGGSVVRGYTFAGSENVIVTRASARNLEAMEGSAMGFDVMTDSKNVRLTHALVRNVRSGWGATMDPNGPTEMPMSIGYRVSEGASEVTIVRGCAVGLDAASDEYAVYDDSDAVTMVAPCRANR